MKDIVCSLAKVRAGVLAHRVSSAYLLDILDQLNAALSLDFITAEELYRLAPHQSVFDLNAPRTVSRNLSFPKTVVSTISHWIHYEEDEAPDPEVVRRMAMIPEAA